ncbi:MAG: site-specific integrase [Planctomycetes bacterium]|nr:site-specific integrase [Planctomycetota bacterium]
MTTKRTDVPAAATAASRPRPVKPPALCCHKRTGRAFVTIDGHQHYLGTYGTSEAARSYGALIAERFGLMPPTIAQEAARDPGRTVSDLVAAYALHVADYFKNGHPSQIAHETLVLRHLDHLHGRLLLRPWDPRSPTRPEDHFGPMHLEAWRDLIVTHRVVRDAEGEPFRLEPRPEPLARKTANDWLRRVRVAFRWGVARELVSPSLWTALEAVASLRKNRSIARESRKVRAVPLHHIRAVLPHLSPALAAVLRVQVSIGARPGEVLGMRVADVDRQGVVVDGKPEWIFRPAAHKGDWRDDVHPGYPLLEADRAILEPFLVGKGPDDYVFSPRDSEAYRNALRRQARKLKVWRAHAPERRRARYAQRQAERCRAQGRPRILRAPTLHYSVDVYRRALERACDAAGVPRFSPHRVRHTVATRIRAAAGVDAAAQALGHKGLDAIHIYAEASIETVVRARRAVPAVS